MKFNKLFILSYFLFSLSFNIFAISLNWLEINVGLLFSVGNTNKNDTLPEIGFCSQIGIIFPIRNIRYIVVVDFGIGHEGSIFTDLSSELFIFNNLLGFSLSFGALFSANDTNDTNDTRYNSAYINISILSKPIKIMKFKLGMDKTLTNNQYKINFSVFFSGVDMFALIGYALLENTYNRYKP